MDQGIPLFEALERRCTRCHVTKPITSFHKKGAQGRMRYCGECRAAQRGPRTGESRGPNGRKKYKQIRTREQQKRDEVRAAYGISLEEYRAKIAKQGGRCKICGDIPTKSRHLHMDHDHATGKLRDMLCMNCNLMLGFAKDSPLRLSLAIAYLRRHADSD